jgi:hypothetical protein
VPWGREGTEGVRGGRRDDTRKDTAGTRRWPLPTRASAEGTIPDSDRPATLDSVTIVRNRPAEP